MEERGLTVVATCFSRVPDVRVCADADHEVYQLPSVTYIYCRIAVETTIALSRCSLTGMPALV